MKNGTWKGPKQASSLRNRLFTGVFKFVTYPACMLAVALGFAWGSSVVGVLFNIPLIQRVMSVIPGELVKSFAVLTQLTASILPTALVPWAATITMGVPLLLIVPTMLSGLLSSLQDPEVQEQGLLRKMGMLSWCIVVPAVGVYLGASVLSMSLLSGLLSVPFINPEATKPGEPSTHAPEVHQENTQDSKTAKHNPKPQIKPKPIVNAFDLKKKSNSAKKQIVQENNLENKLQNKI